MIVNKIKKCLLPIRDFLLKRLYSFFLNTESTLTDAKFMGLVRDLRKNKYRIGLFSSAKNKDCVVVYMSSNHQHGGLADRLRTMRTAYVCAAINNKKFYIYHNVNNLIIEEYLSPNKIDWRIKKEDIDFCLKNISVCAYYKVIPEIRHSREVHMYSSDGIISEMKNAPANPLLTDHEVHHFLFKPTSFLERMVQQTMEENQLIENEYIAFHLRFLNFFEPVEINGVVSSTQEEQLQMIQDVHRVIDKVYRESTIKNVVIFSDSNLFLNSKHPEYIKYIPGVVGHISKHADKQITDKTFVDLFIMSKAKAIYSIRGKNIYGGGFSREASIIGNKPFIQVPLKEGDRQGFIGTYGNN